jgi:multidrug efflux pump subunit AcrA (membrane-fusion protein)
MSPNDLRIRFSASGRTLTPDALTLVPDVEPTSQLLTVVASLENPDREHTPGESITGLVPVAAEASYWHFPTDAVVRTPMGAFVYRASPENTAERVAVEVAFERDGEAFVLVASSSTLGAEDQLIVEGNERLIPGQPLMIQVRRGAPSPTQP